MLRMAELYQDAESYFSAEQIARAFAEEAEDAAQRDDREGGRGVGSRAGGPQGRDTRQDR